jgi:heme-degrading monooxygenase HmoA
MVYILVQHEVKDFAAWKKGFDAHFAMRKKAGEVSADVFTNKERPREVFVLNCWDTLERAEAFMHSAELKQAMMALGVVGKPTITVLEKH